MSFIGVTSILTLQNNPPISAQILEDTMKRVEDDNTIKRTSDGSGKEEVSGEAKDIKDIM